MIDSSKSSLAEVFSLIFSALRHLLETGGLQINEIELNGISFCQLMSNCLFLFTRMSHSLSTFC